MNLEATGPVPEGDRPDAAATTQLNTDSLLAVCDIYVVLLVGRSGNYLRKPYLSLHSAQQALARAQDRGQECHLVLARLVPVAADLDLDGGAR
jgi:hypothetical protein